MKQVFFLLYLTLIIQNINAQVAPEPTGRRLRVIMEDKYADSSIIVGATTGAWAWYLNTSTGTILDREFNYVTPENDFKMGSIMGETNPLDSSTWSWLKPDVWISHIDSNGQILRMHCPIGPQTTEWSEDDSRTASELDSNMSTFMHAICERYNGVPGFEYMDVVNETVINGAWHTDQPGTGNWENPWFKIGQDTDINNTPLYIKKAFQIATQYAPDIKLIYNHHEGPEMTNSWNLIKETINYLRNQGLRVDGIGWQAHVDVGWETPSNLQALRDLIDWAHSNQLEFHVTEASVWLTQGNSQTYLDQQAATYRAIVEVLLEKRSSGKVGWNTWNIDDKYGWHTEWHPALFDSNYVAKPAYYAIQEALENGSTGVVNPKKHLNTFQLYNYPNPFISSTTIVLNKKVTEAKLYIYDIMGNLLKTDSIKNNKEFVVMGDEFSSGMYFFSVAGDNGIIGQGKMIILK